MGRRGSKIDDNGMKWHHFLVKKLMVTSFFVKTITFEQFLNIFEKSQKNLKKIEFSKLSNISFAPVKKSKSRFFASVIFLPIWRYGGKVTYRIMLAKRLALDQNSTSPLGDRLVRGILDPH